jgi:hypothetical protein
LDDLFEDFELMKMMAKCIGVWSLERKHYISIYSSYFSSHPLKCNLYCIFIFLPI